MPGRSSPCSRAQSIAVSYPASAWRMTPVAGSFHSTRSIRRAASSGAVAADHHPRVLRKAHADPAPVMDRHPGRPRCAVQQGVQKRPVRDRIRSVLHRLGLPVRRRDRPGIEMIASDDDRGLQLSAAHHLVEREAEPVPLPEPHPADPGRQPLEADPLPRHVEPVVQVRIVRNQRLHLLVGPVDVFRIAGQRAPAERPDAATEEGADARRDEPREGEGVAEALVPGDLADVVPVVDGRHSPVREGDHRFHMDANRFAGRRLYRRGIVFSLRTPFGQGPARGQVAVARIVRRRLVGDQVGKDAPSHELREDVRGVAENRDRLCLTRPRPAFDHRQRFVQRSGLLVHVAGANSEVDAVRVALHRQAAGAGHHRRERLRPSHAPESGGQDPASAQIAVVVLSSDFDEGLVGALHNPLAADVDPRPRRHLAVHGEALAVELVEVRPVSPVRNQVRVRDQHPGGIPVGAEHSHRLAGLHEQRLVLVHPLQGGDDAVEVPPGPRRSTDAAIDHQLVRVLRHLGMEVVHQHPHRRLGQPGLRGDLGAGGRVDDAGVRGRVVHRIGFSIVSQFQLGRIGRRRNPANPCPHQSHGNRPSRFEI